MNAVMPQALRPPKAPPPRKAGHAAGCQRLEQLPNTGPSLAADRKQRDGAR